MHQKIVVALTVLLTGCATSSGIQPMSNGAYRMHHKAASGFNGSDTIKADLTLQASGFCADDGKFVYVINSLTGQPPYIFGNFPWAEIQFRCVTERELRALAAP